MDMCVHSKREYWWYRRYFEQFLEQLTRNNGQIVVAKETTTTENKKNLQLIYFDDANRGEGVVGHSESIESSDRVHYLLVNWKHSWLTAISLRDREER